MSYRPYSALFVLFVNAPAALTQDAVPQSLSITITFSSEEERAAAIRPLLRTACQVSRAKPRVVCSGCDAEQEKLLKCEIEEARAAADLPLQRYGSEARGTLAAVTVIFVLGLFVSQIREIRKLKRELSQLEQDWAARLTNREIELRTDFVQQMELQNKQFAGDVRRSLERIRAGRELLRSLGDLIDMRKADLEETARWMGAYLSEILALYLPRQREGMFAKILERLDYWSKMKDRGHDLPTLLEVLNRIRSVLKHTS